MKPNCFFLSILLFISSALPFSRGEIVVSSGAGEIEQYASLEMQRYFYQLTGELLEINSGAPVKSGKGPLCIIGTVSSSPLLAKLQTEGQLPKSDAMPGAEGYVLKTIKINGRDALAIVGADEIGCLYGVYGFLDEHWGVGFHFDGDVLPAEKIKPEFPVVDETKTPLMATRGMLPWTNFLQSPSSYSWEDWKFILDQAAKMRMNFILIHNYNGDFGHNEMFHNFEVNGIISRTWMATGRSGAGGNRGIPVSRWVFGQAADLVDDYDFGSEVGLHNERLDNRQVFRKGVNMFQRVIKYAHGRGIKIGLGLDINKIPADYNLPAEDPAVMKARIEQILTDYPDLDYITCFKSETIKREGQEGWDRWLKVFNAFYAAFKERAPHVRIAVSGWGDAPTKAELNMLPSDVISAQIAGYSASFVNGKRYAPYEYWGCPWLESDINSSQYYYPYRIHLSDTIKSWQNRSSNMKGFYCLTWRITDAISPKLWYIARAPWDVNNELRDSRTVYREFAKRHYGEKVADAITEIINENEPVVNPKYGECGPTPPFEVEAPKGDLFAIKSAKFSGQGVDAWEIKMTDYQDQRGVRERREEGGDAFLSDIQSGDWAAYALPKKTETKKWTKFEVQVQPAENGGKIEIRAASVEGQKLGEILVPAAEKDKREWLALGATVDTDLLRRGSVYLVFPTRSGEDELAKADEQLKVIDQCIEQTNNPMQKYRLGLLRNRIAAAREHIYINIHFGNYKIWPMPVEPFEAWVKNFVQRVTDISFFGSVTSIQNRALQKNYMPKRDTLLLQSARGAPAIDVQARGTRDGAVITWNAEREGATGYDVYRGSGKITEKPLSPDIRSFEDKGASGRFRYSVKAITEGDRESTQTSAVFINAGSADTEAPQIVVISPPTSARMGQTVMIKARLIDSRVYSLQNAILVWRTAGDKAWKRQPMTRRVKSVFTADITPDSPGLLEYYVEASDGDNVSVLPAAAPARTFTLVVESNNIRKVGPATPKLKAEGTTLTWEKTDNACYYRIYRSQDPKFSAGSENYLTYVAADATPTFEDNGEDFTGKPLSGAWYYRISTVNKHGIESAASAPVKIDWPNPICL